MDFTNLDHSHNPLIGRPQRACGAAGMAAPLLATRNGIAPPTLNLEDPDPECDLDYVPN